MRIERSWIRKNVNRGEINLNYGEAIDYIQGLTRFGIRLGLERTRYILERMGNPHHAYPSVHIGGTNGKGSTVALVESAALAAGLKVGRFTSPHLLQYNERIVINRESIRDEAFAALVDSIIPILDEAGKRPEFGAPTEFEVGTILAFLYFAQSKVDLAIIEVGMGGRLDSTNVLKPLAVGLTHIDLDHQEILGPDLASIAREKAGIIKDRTPIVSALAYPEVDRVLTIRARACRAPLYRVGEAVACQIMDWGAYGSDLQLGWCDESPKRYMVNLLGVHQAQNAAVAYGLLKLLEKSRFPTITHEAIYQGFSSTVWPGRLERIPGDPEILLDGGHNPDGFRAMATAVEKIFSGRPVIALIGILNNRPIESMVNILAPLITSAIATDVPDNKGLSSERTFQAFLAAGVPVERCSDPYDALQIAIKHAKQTGALLLIAGSLYLVGHLRPFVIERG